MTGLRPDANWRIDQLTKFVNSMVRNINALEARVKQLEMKQFTNCVS